MASTHEENRAALAREREARKTAYLAAVATRDEIAGFANGADATDFDRRELARAEARVSTALNSMRQWGDDIPAETAAVEVTATRTSPVEAAGVVSPNVDDGVEATARRILNSANGVAGGPAADPEVEAVAQRILAAAEVAVDELNGYGHPLR